MQAKANIHYLDRYNLKSRKKHKDRILIFSLTRFNLVVKYAEFSRKDLFSLLSVLVCQLTEFDRFLP